MPRKSRPTERALYAQEPGHEEALRFFEAPRNPYAKRLKKQVTIRLEEPTLAYFKSLGERMGMPYQTLNNMYLRDCAENRKELRLQWRPSDDAG
jgi:predicted DNA binding CopG/RHH family protein